MFFYFIIFSTLMISYGLIRTLKVFKYVRTSSYRNWWVVLFFLILFFVFGYITYAGLQFTSLKVNPDFLVVGIFVFGAFYVLITIDLMHKTLKEDVILQKTTQEYAERVENMFQEKSAVLENKNVELKKIITELSDSKDAMMNILEDMSYSEERLKLSLKESETLAGLSRDIIFAEDFTNLIKKITAKIALEMEAKRVFLFLYNKENKKLEIQEGSHGLNKKLVNIFGIDINNSLNGDSFINEKIVVSLDVSNDKKACSMKKFFQSKNSIIAPVYAGKKVVGTICCTDSKKDLKDKNIINFYDRLVKVSSTVISNSRLLTSIKVKESEEQAILKSIGSGLLVVDDKGNILEMNKVAENNFKVKRSEALGKSVKGLLGFEDLEEILSDFSKSVNNKKIVKRGHKISCITKNNKYDCWENINKFKKECGNCNVFKTNTEKVINLFFKKTGLTFSAVISPIIAEDEKDKTHGFIVGQVLTMTDITKEVEMNKAKDVFLSVTSHELRTPMTAIAGNLKMVLDGEAGKVDNFTREFLEDAYVGSQRLLALVEDMLNVSRVEQGRMVYHIDNFLISDVIKKTIESLIGIAKTKKLFIKYRPFSKKIEVIADQGKVMEIITNLVGNSIKFTEKGGITINHKIKENKLITFIEDTGMGMKREDWKNLFKKFSQINLTLTNQKGGTGLGLYICKQYIKAMGGNIWIEKSVFGKGTVFAFSLPLNNINNKNKKHDKSTIIK